MIVYNLFTRYVSEWYPPSYGIHKQSNKFRELLIAGNTYLVCKIQEHQDTQSCVSGQECADTQVHYLRDRLSSRFQPLVIQKLLGLFLPNLHVLVPSYILPHMPNLKEIALAVPEIRVPESRQIFFIVFFFFFTPNDKCV